MYQTAVIKDELIKREDVLTGVHLPSALNSSPSCVFISSPTAVSAHPSKPAWDKRQVAVA